MVKETYYWASFEGGKIVIHEHYMETNKTFRTHREAVQALRDQAVVIQANKIGRITPERKKQVDHMKRAEAAAESWLKEHKS